MSNFDEEFLSVFNEYYPYERYIIENPKPIGNLFDDLLLTEIFIPKTEIKLIVDEDGTDYFTKINSDDVYVKVKGCAGEMRIGYFDFAYNIRQNIRDIFCEDFGAYEYECLYVEYEDLSQLKNKLEFQKELIISKYGECNIKSFAVRSTLINKI